MYMHKGSSTFITALKIKESTYALSVEGKSNDTGNWKF